MSQIISFPTNLGELFGKCRYLEGNSLIFGEILIFGSFSTVFPQNE